MHAATVCIPTSVSRLYSVFHLTATRKYTLFQILLPMDTVTVYILTSVSRLHSVFHPAATRCNTRIKISLPMHAATVCILTSVSRLYSVFTTLQHAATRYSPFPRRRDSTLSSECNTRSPMVRAGLFSNGSCEKRSEVCSDEHFESWRAFFPGSSCNTHLFAHGRCYFGSQVSFATDIGLFCRKSPMKETIFCKRDLNLDSIFTTLQHARSHLIAHGRCHRLHSHRFLLKKEPCKRDYILQKSPRTMPPSAFTQVSFANRARFVLQKEPCKRDYILQKSPRTMPPSAFTQVSFAKRAL